MTNDDAQVAMDFAAQFADRYDIRYLPMVIALMAYRVSPRGKEQQALALCFALARKEMQQLITTIREAEGGVH